MACNITPKVAEGGERAEDGGEVWRGGRKRYIAEGGGETLERGSDSNADETEKCRPPDTMDAN